VATALRPPKSIEDAPPTSECALWINSEISTKTSAAAQGLYKQKRSATSDAAIPKNAKKMTGARRA